MLQTVKKMLGDALPLTACCCCCLLLLLLCCRSRCCCCCCSFSSSCCNIHRGAVVLASDQKNFLFETYRLSECKATLCYLKTITLRPSSTTDSLGGPLVEMTSILLTEFR